MHPESKPRRRHVCTPSCRHVCERCGDSFIPESRSDQRFCSKRCRIADWRERHRRPCSVDGCENDAIAGLRSGLCAMHRWRVRYESPRGLDPKKCRRGVCAVEGCARLANVRGYCSMHDQRIRKYREPGPVGPKTRAKGTGCLTPSGYLRITVDGKPIPEHRHVMESRIGRPIESWETVHHKNGVRSDNRAENLELWIRGHPGGQRVEDMAAFMVEHYRDAVMAALGAN